MLQDQYVLLISYVTSVRPDKLTILVLQGKKHRKSKLPSKKQNPCLRITPS